MNWEGFAQISLIYIIFKVLLWFGRKISQAKFYTSVDLIYVYEQTFGYTV